MPVLVQQLPGVVVIGVRICASLLRLKSIVGCSRNTRIGKFPALGCVWKDITNSEESIFWRLGFSTVVLSFSLFCDLFVLI